MEKRKVMNLTMYIEVRTAANLEDETISLTSAWLVIKDEDNNQLITSHDLSDHPDMLNLFKSVSFSEDV